MKSAICGIALLLGLWLGWSFQTPATQDWGGANADAHRLGPVVESTAALPEAGSERGAVNLFLVLTAGEEDAVALR